MMKQIFPPLMLAAAVFAGTMLGTHGVQASDHDDGTADYKTVNTNFTDLFVFNEQSHVDGTAPAGDTDVVLVMNVNPRSLPQQQYFFHTDALYDFNVRRVTGANNLAIAADASVADLVIRCQFAEPDAVTNRQAMTLTAYEQAGATTLSAVSQTAATTRNAVDGTVLGAGDIVTTAHPFVVPPAGVDAGVPDDANAVGRRTYATDNAIENQLTLSGSTLSAFAGLREDPFYFDVEKYFRVRASAARGQYAFRFENANAVDFTTGYNVLSIVLRVPRAFLAGTSGATTFDVWETIRVRV